MLKKGGLIPFDGVTDKLKDPTENEKRQCPTPIKEEQRQRDGNHRNADDVTEFVHRMSMLRFVILDVCVGHDKLEPQVVNKAACLLLRLYEPECSQTSMKISIVPPQTMPSSLASSAVSEK